jgi:hypothetical protein
MPAWEGVERVAQRVLEQDPVVLQADARHPEAKKTHPHLDQDSSRSQGLILWRQDRGDPYAALLPPAHCKTIFQSSRIPLGKPVLRHAWPAVQE